ncbi:hypothetical protein [Nonomuraea sp. NPDC048916]|uniref:hypothetical protein n=1 Tax=Nonomuraea sp. NPDC048916 TaxID=3154232 RepID=UPI0033D7F383
MTTGFTGSSELKGEQEPDVPFDPEATGIIPRISLSGESGGPADTPSPEAGPAAGDDDVADSDTTTALRLPTLRIGGPPTVPDVTASPSSPPTDADPGGASQSDETPGAGPSPRADGAQGEGTAPAKDSPSGASRTDSARGEGAAPAKDRSSGTSTADGPDTEALPAAGTAPADDPATETLPVTSVARADDGRPSRPGESRPPGGASQSGETSSGRATPPAGGAAGGRGSSTRTDTSRAEGMTPAERGPDDATGQSPGKGGGAGTAPRTGGTAGRSPGTGGTTARKAGAAGMRPGTGGTTTPSKDGTAGTAPGEGGRTGTGGTEALQGAPQAPLGAPGAPQAPHGPQAPQIAPQASPGARAARPAGKGGAWGPRRLLHSAPTWLPILLTVEALVMYILALRVAPGPYRGVDPDDINGLGLIAALPATAFVAILIMLVAFFVTVAQSTDRKFLLLFQIAVITFALHGAGALVADEPRFPTAYIHAGFVDFIGRTGETAINIDARMGWPGYFALFAFVTKAAGISDMTTILQWTPLLSNLLYLLPFVLILRQVVATTRARWFAALLFVLVQWIGQDYFSPQGFTFALYLAFVAILLRWFGRVEPRTEPVPPKGLRKLLGRLDAMTPGEIANTGTFRADKLLMLTLLLALFFASTASHQITPFMMLGVVTAFLIFKRTSLTWALPFSLGLVVLAWISYEAVGFWASQIDTIFGGLGRIFDNIQSNTGDRIEGSDPAHALVLQARLGILVVILSLAATGLLRRLRRGVFDRAALILLCVPVMALGLQSYGGEIGLRIYMFALPGACLLAAYAFFPNLPADSADVREETIPIRRRNVRFNPEVTRKVTVVLAASVSVVLAMAFLVARYGNEKFERVTSGEVAAMHYVYDHDKPSARVLYLVPKEGPEVTPTLPWGEKDVELVNFTGQALVYKDPTQIAKAVAKLKESPRNTYLVVSRGQVGYLQLNEGFPKDWGEKFRAALDASPDLKKVYSNEDAALYTWKTFVRGTEIPDPQPYKGRGDPTSPWTPVGIGALAVTWITFFAYEVIRLHGPNRARRARKRLLFLAIPAFLVAVGVIVERFIYIAQNN